jgi:hypothetical protein
VDIPLKTWNQLESWVFESYESILALENREMSVVLK